MKIGIDINPTIGIIKGKGYFLKNLLIELSYIDKTNMYILFSKSYPNYKLPVNSVVDIINGNEGFKWDLNCIRKSRLKYNVDLFVSFKSFYSVVLFPRSIIGIHDIGPITYPEGYPYETIKRFKILSYVALKRCKKIIVPSKATKSSIINHFKINKEKIVKIQPAVPDWTKKKITLSDLERVKQRYKLPENFFLFVGTLEPRKNLNTLIKAFKEFKKDDKNDYKLVIVGKKGFRHEEIFKTVIDCELTHNIVFTGHIKEYDLKPIYVLAKAFVFPSILEGFGLTPLEAMACGLPVISSRKGAIGEVVDKYSLEINPMNINSIANAMIIISKDKALRENLSLEGKERAKKFSWEKAAKKFLKLIGDIK